jgi:tetratricopeptide (TPR) repeat protein
LVFPVLLWGQVEVDALNKGVVLHNKGDLKGAKVAYQKAIRANSTYTQAHLNLGYAHEGLLEWKEAKEQFLKVLKLAPEHKEGLHGLGRAYRSLGAHEKAVKSFERALDKHPNDELILFDCAWTYYDLRVLETAAVRMEKAASLTDKKAEYYTNAGRFWQEKGEKTKAAIRCYNKAIDFDAKCVNAYVGRGTCYMEEERFEQALKDLNRAKDLQPDVDIQYLIDAANAGIEEE